MKTILKNKGLLILVLMGFISHGQSNTLDFTLTSQNYTVSGQQVNLQSIIKKAGNTLIWTQIDGNVSDTSTATIEHTTGTWDSSSSSGTMTYKITIGSFTSKLIVQGDNGHLSAKLVVYTSENKQHTYIFSTNRIAYP